MIVNLMDGYAFILRNKYDWSNMGKGKEGGKKEAKKPVRASQACRIGALEDGRASAVARRFSDGLHIGGLLLSAT
jgi:hypothetical protein